MVYIIFGIFVLQESNESRRTSVVDGIERTKFREKNGTDRTRRM